MRRMRAIWIGIIGAMAAANSAAVSRICCDCGMPQMEAGQSPSQAQMPGMDTNNGSMNAAAAFLMSRASGTSANPASAPVGMLSTSADGWRLMLHGEGFVSDVQQTGPRGADKFFSTNWFMGMAEHQVGRGAFSARLMMSLEPATVTERRYPELFQTGETAFGEPLVDGQHPHNLFMEVSFAYAYAFSEHTTATIYVAPVGDPALGPVAFPHRDSAEELPQAPLSHHLQDSTHISYEVVTGALKERQFTIEMSGFRGAEPNENRWNIETGRIDSWAARLDWAPGKNWSAQASVGRLHNPELLEPGDIVRATASVSYSRPLHDGNWATSAIWGRNHEVATQRNLNSYLLESVLQFLRKNYITGRAELLDRDELFADEPLLELQLASQVGSTFRVGAFTAGYTRDIHLLPHLLTGLGSNLTLYRVPDAIQPYYGAHPVAIYAFLRFRLEGSGMKM
jgi:hypothetical protein